MSLLWFEPHFDLRTVKEGKSPKLIVFLWTPLCICLLFVSLSSYIWPHPRIFSHPNVLPMLGACQCPPAPHPIIITHWMPYGSLYNVLHEGTSEYFHPKVLTLSPVFFILEEVLFRCTSVPLNTLSWRELIWFVSSYAPSDFVVDQTQAVKFALDIASGMAFLHTLEPMIPRHYLNSRSVMVKTCFIAPSIRRHNLLVTISTVNHIKLPMRRVSSQLDSCYNR